MIPHSISLRLQSDYSIDVFYTPPSGLVCGAHTYTVPPFITHSPSPFFPLLPPSTSVYIYIFPPMILYSKSLSSRLDDHAS